MACPVDPPTCDRALHGILDCANIKPVDATARELGGVSFSPLACGRAYAWQPGCDRNEDCEPVCDETGEPMGKAVDGVCDPEQSAPVTIYGTFKCSTLSYGGDFERYRQRAVDSLNGGMSKALEEFLWQGASTVYTEIDGEIVEEIGCISPCATYFNDPTVPMVCEDPKDACLGLGLLIQYLASCGEGAKGMIHAPAIIVNAWLCCGLIHCTEGRGFDGRMVPRLETKIGGHCVVAGGGYSEKGPGGECTDGVAYAYATRCMDLYVGPVEVPQQNMEQAIDHKTNTVIVYAERTVVPAFDSCCVAGIPLTYC